MKKTLTILLVSALILVSAVAFTSCDDAADSDVYVTITNGNIVLAYEDVDLTDADSDGALTVNDALYLAHEEKYTGGAAAGYASENTQYGLSLMKLWGNDTGSYGYTVNNVSAMSLADAIKPGDHIVAYVYTDLTAWSDTYCYFDKVEIDAKKNMEFMLTLTMNSYDAEWNSVSMPVEGAIITVDGSETEYVTDAAGKVTLSLTDDAVISAISDTLTLVPPICVVDID